MVTPSPRLPTKDELRDIVRGCRLTPESAKAVAAALVEVVREIEAGMAVPEAKRRDRRRQRIAFHKAMAVNWRRSVDLIETTRPDDATELRKVLGDDIGLLFSSDAYARLLDLPVVRTLSPRDRESRAATSRAGPYALLEEHAKINRQELASRRGHRLLAAIHKRLAERSEAELEAERANTCGRPAHRARQIALVRLLQLHERLTGRPAPSRPSEAFREFAQFCFVAIDLPTKGLERATDRLFDRIREGREGASSMSTSRKSRSKSRKASA